MQPTHLQILKRHGAAEVADKLGLKATTVRMWQNRQRIPSEHWAKMAALELASLEELALAEQAAHLRRARAA